MKTSSKLYIGFILMLLTGCGIYSFTGVAITAKTISIPKFYNDADGGPPDLEQLFTNEIRDYYQQNTSLVLVEDDGEIQLEGSVTGYRLTPVAPQAVSNNQTGLGAETDPAALTRLTITVRVSYVNTTDDSFDFKDRNFSFYQDFDNTENLTAIEAGLIQTIYEQVILDIFNATVANW